MQIIVLSHGPMAEGMVQSATMIIGPRQNVTSLTLKREDEIGYFKDRLRAMLDSFGDEEVICLTDLLHGSPFNAVVSQMGDFPVAHLTGANLAMVIQACIRSKTKNMTARKLCAELAELRSTSVVDVNSLFENDTEE
ncbi:MULTISPECIES: PTS sugar transporter subunit IIA [unclassified Luteococcus]|uniref:PTS sugar transporter subunit IIA n=1 Tax=unclassified Luteococcus TaxID=2639923 RepID=UPI00313C720E